MLITEIDVVRGIGLATYGSGHQHLLRFDLNQILEDVDVPFYITSKIF